MKVLGITFSVPFITENEFVGNRYLLGHDSSAVLISDGVIVSAIEEERLNRIKHTDKAPILALRQCLENFSINEIDYIAVNFDEPTLDYVFRQAYLDDMKQTSIYNARLHIKRVIKEAFGVEIEDEKIKFVKHHLAHAESAFALSGFDESLVMVIDGRGDTASGIIQTRTKEKSEILYEIPLISSLGHFYLYIINHLGYKIFDEYKVMGLAPYGNPKIYESLFKEFYELYPKGKFIINQQKFHKLFDICLPRRKGEEFSQVHMDIAAALQQSLEEIILHVLSYYREKTGLKNLCLAGGVAHNCSANGKILSSGLFDKMFVQPAAHDAGTALGAALYVTNNYGNENDKVSGYLNNIYLGTDVKDNDSIRETLSKWKSFIQYEKKDNITKTAAKLIYDGNVIGWVQGRAEFGPRALGNRSIIADPRPFENKKRINAMVKKREAYRPFAPSVLQEYVGKYFNLPTDQNSFPFMNFVLKVQDDFQGQLQAITHVDGTARVQTVAKDDNQRYRELINEFGKLSDIYMVLNTSFNNNAEPIVDSVEDAIVCYLTTNINYLIIGDYLITKYELDEKRFLDSRVTIKPYIKLCSIKKCNANNESVYEYKLTYNYDSCKEYGISREAFDFFSYRGENKSFGKITDELGSSIPLLLDEIKVLWSERLIEIEPGQVM